MPIGAAIPAIIGGLASAGQAISGASNLRKDKAELARLSPAFYKIQDEYYGNYNQAAEMAGSGLTAGAKDYYSDMAGRGLGSAIGATMESGGSPNDIAKMFDSYNQSIRSLGVEDSERQVANIKYFQQVGKDLAGQKTQQWVINEYAPYQNKLKELTNRIAADKQNIWGGIQGVAGAAQAGVTAMQNDKLLNDLFKGVGDKDVGTKINAMGIVDKINKDVKFDFPERQKLSLPDPYPGQNINRPALNVPLSYQLGQPMGMSPEDFDTM
jgi:hypothetical protein